MSPDGPLYRLVYVSRNTIAGGPPAVEAELVRILDAARRTNARLGVTGALLFGAGCFAQALEGPLPAIEAVFEAIQRDPRHAEVALIEAGPAAAREFAGWSMAYAGPGEGRPSAAVAALFAPGAEPPSAERLLGLMRGVVRHAGAFAGA